MHRISVRGVAAATVVGTIIGATTLAASAAARVPSTEPAAGLPGAPVLTSWVDWRFRVAYRPARVSRHRPARHKAADRTQHTQPAPLDPQALAEQQLAAAGGDYTQWVCLDELWARESGWNPYATNASGAYGIPQALPADKMAVVGADWQTDPYTQIRWGLAYIATSYGDPCAALQHDLTYGYY
jgi:hypothetical protein